MKPIWDFFGTMATNIANLIGMGTTNNKQYDQERKMADYTYGKDMEMWKMQNEYNLPVNQVQRLKDAGINPAFMYQGSPQNVATQMPKYQSPRAEYNFQPMENPFMKLNAIQDFKVKQAQEDLLKANAEIARERASAEIYNTMIKRYTQADLWWKNEKHQMYDNDLARIQHESAKIGLKKLQQDLQFKTNQMLQQDQDLLRSKKLNQWLQGGITPQDKIWMRLLFQNSGKAKSYFNNGYPNNRTLGQERYVPPNPWD